MIAKPQNSDKCRKETCTRPRAEYARLCVECRDSNRASLRRRYAKTKRFNADNPHLCSKYSCEAAVESGFRMCRACLDHENELTKRRNRKLKLETLAAYGGICSCCGEGCESFLSIDHIAGFDGTGPRKSIPLFRWLKKNKHPSGFRVLCMNCNVSYGRYGYCPHSSDACGSGARNDLRRLVFSMCGRSCNCCGVSNIEFLTVDHIHNDGAEHRRGLRKDIYHWITETGPHPEILQVLCMNCNFSKGHLGQCAHRSFTSS